MDHDNLIQATVSAQGSRYNTKGSPRGMIHASRAEILVRFGRND